MTMMDRFLPDDLTEFCLGHITRDIITVFVFANLVFTHEGTIDVSSRCLVID